MSGIFSVFYVATYLSVYTYSVIGKLSKSVLLSAQGIESQETICMRIRC